MGQMLLLVLLSCGIYRVIGTLNPSITFLFVNQTKAFDEAQRYCRDTYIDLVTLWDRAGVEELFAVGNFAFTGSAWIGLEKTSRQLWQWALADQELYKDGETEYRNWVQGQPDNAAGDEYCSVMTDVGQFRDVSCELVRSFICYNGPNNEPKYILINEPKSWREAQSYCRQFHTDLVSVRNPDENLQIQRLIPAGGRTYVGLFQDAFAWSDSSTSSFRNWDSDQPDGSGECVAQQLQDRRLWEDQACSSPRPFFCYARVDTGLDHVMNSWLTADAGLADVACLNFPVFKQVLRLELESDQNMNDPDVRASILQEIQQKLISQGMPEMANLQWRQQANGHVFQEL